MGGHFSTPIDTPTVKPAPEPAAAPPVAPKELLDEDAGRAAAIQELREQMRPK